MNTSEYLLTCLIEECAEIAKAATKAQRFGLENHEPESMITNAEQICFELGDVIAVAELLRERVMVTWPPSPEAINRKKRKIREWMGYSFNRGTLSETKP